MVSEDDFLGFSVVILAHVHGDSTLLKVTTPNTKSVTLIPHQQPRLEHSGHWKGHRTGGEALRSNMVKQYMNIDKPSIQIDGVNPTHKNGPFGGSAAVAPGPANGQPPTPPTAASTLDTPNCKASDGRFRDSMGSKCRG